MATAELHTAPSWARTTDWQQRAAIAEHSVLSRHVVRSFFLPFTATGMSAWPYLWKQRINQSWNFWWQAHLIGCVVDAIDRADTPRIQRLLRRLVRTHYLLNGRRWRHNEYYDDLAWAAIDVQRAENRGYVSGYRTALGYVRGKFEQAYNPKYAIPWKVGEEFWNTPANGPVAIFLARCGDKRGEQMAEKICDWMYQTLQFKDGPYEGLYADGLRIVDGMEKRIDYVFTYCQGVAMGAELELALRTTGTRQQEHLRRVCEIVEACERSLLSPKGVLLAGGGGDGGLFKGILIRYLADVARRMPEVDAAPGVPLWDGRLRQVQQAAARMVMRNAKAVWDTAAWLPEGMLFSAQWNDLAQLPLKVEELGKNWKQNRKVAGVVQSSEVPEQDLSTQLSGWMTLEAAARLVRSDGFSTLFH